MDIALMSMALSQGQAKQQASMSVMKMAMGNAEQQGESLQKLISANDTADFSTLHSHIWVGTLI